MPDSVYSNSNIRASVRAFAIGKTITAPATFVLVFLFATFMARPQYASYVAATAMLEIGIAVGTFGLDWLSQTVLPSIRVHGNRTQLRRALAVLMGFQLAPYAVLAIAMFAFAPHVSSLFGNVVPTDVVRVYAIVLPIEGVFRFLRDQAMAALLLQRVVQMLQMLRLVLMISTLCALHFSHIDITANHIGYAELASSVIGLSIAAMVTIRYLNASTTASGDADLSRWLNRGAVRFATHAYLSFMLTICLGQEVVTSFVARYLGAEATAQFGLSVRLIEQVRRFLPMDLLWMLIRPALVGRFEREGRNFTRLASDVGMILRANLLLLGAITAVFLGVGNDIVRILTHGNIHLPAFLLAAMLVQVLGHSVRRSLELITFLIGQSQLFLYGSFAALSVPLVLVMSLESTQSLYTVACAMALAETLFCSVVYRGLVASGRQADIESFTWVKVAACVALSALCTSLIARLSGDLFVTGLAIVTGLVTYVGALMLLRVFTLSDTSALIGMVRPRTPAAGPAPL